MDAYINNYEGHWRDGDGHYLHVTIVNETTAHVSFFSSEELKPIKRPRCNNKPTIGMEARYYPFEGPGLVVALCGLGTGFCLDLLYEENIFIDGVAQEVLAPSLTRYGKDDFLDQYYRYFGALKNYTRYAQ